MTRGRPPKKLGHIDDLDGGAEEKARLQILLATLSGEITVKEAARRLGLSESRVHALRKQALQGALDGLAPQPSGRPPNPPPEVDVDALETRVRDLETELTLSRVKTEVALTMPHLLQKDPDLLDGEEEKGGLTRKERRAQERRDQRAGRRKGKRS